MSGQESDNDMTPQPAAVDEPAFPDLKLGDAWGESITRQRAAELEEILQAWKVETEYERDAGRGAFHKVPLTGADVFWLTALALARTSDSKSIWTQAVRLNDARSSRQSSGQVVIGVSALHLEGCVLYGAHLEGANLYGAHLERADLGHAHLSGANLQKAYLERAILFRAHLEGANLREAHLESTIFSRANLEDTDLKGAQMKNADFGEAHLERAFLYQAQLEGASFSEAQLEGASLIEARLKGTSFSKAHLGNADLQRTFLDSATTLDNVVLGNEKYGYVSVADVRWGDVNLAVVNWTRTTHGFLHLRKRVEAIELGDEREARSPIVRTSLFERLYGWDDMEVMEVKKDRVAWLEGYIRAVRANRQVATVLRQQGLNEDADRFAYKAQKLQREVLRRQRRYGAAFGSWLLDVIAGHGYKPMRTLTVYLLAIITFAIAYFALGQTVGPHLSPLGAFVFSMTSFHGRGFFPGGIVLDDPITVLAAFEAFIGLVIEVSFIATFTQRFFAR